MALLIPLLVVDIVLLVDAFMGFGIANPLKLCLSRDILLKIAARASALARLKLGAVAVDYVAIIGLTGSVGAALVHNSLLGSGNGSGRNPVPRFAGGTMSKRLKLGTQCSKASPIW